MYVVRICVIEFQIYFVTGNNTRGADGTRTDTDLHDVRTALGKFRNRFRSADVACANRELRVFFADGPVYVMEVMTL